MDSPYGRLGRTAALALAHQRLDDAMTTSDDPDGRAAGAAERLNFLLAEDVNAALPANVFDPLARAVAATRAVLRAQASALDAGATAPAPPQHATPSAAILALGELVGATPTVEEQQAIASLDALPAAQASALARLVDATHAYVVASEAAWAGVDLDAPPASVPPGVARVRLAEIAMIDAALGVRDAFPSSATGAACPPTHTFLHVLALDLSGCDTTYAGSDFVLLVDVAGAEAYLNNDGGGYLVPGALVDLAGNDLHQGRARGGVTGGGEGSSGFLLDLAGNDRYGPSGVNGGANGGAHIGDGLLIDVLGDDQYEGADTGVNGGAYAGVGLLVDADGADRYRGGSWGSNGGGMSGVGALVDLRGNDRYNTSGRGGNGGGMGGGRGFLYDAAGHDEYGGGGGGANGGGYNLAGAGLLYDVAGNDRYLGGAMGVNGGSYEASAGALIDEAGVDSYQARDFGANGGTSLLGFFGMLLDGGGTGDAYADTQTNFPGSGTDRTVIPKGAGGQQIDRLG